MKVRVRNKVLTISFDDKIAYKYEMIYTDETYKNCRKCVEEQKRFMGNTICVERFINSHDKNRTCNNTVLVYRGVESTIHTSITDVELAINDVVCKESCPYSDDCDSSDYCIKKLIMEKISND